MAFRTNRYFGLRSLIFFRLLFSRKLSLYKFLNLFSCYIHYFLGSTASGHSPIAINFELWNECNESCVFCRSESGAIYDSNPSADSKIIPKGKLDFETYIKVLDAFSKYLVMAIPYINGEPLLSKDIYRAINAATQRGIGTLIASNGILLNESNSRKLIDAGLDCLKVHISGFTSPIHSIQHRKGDVERIKRNLVRFMELRTQMGAKTIVLLDFIRYKHNTHEIEEASRFAKEHGVLFSIRPGNPKGMEFSEPTQLDRQLPINIPCDWLWTVLTIDWDGSLYPCCDHVVWSGVPAYGNVKHTNVEKLWLSPEVKAMRNTHLVKGRSPIPICSECPRQGVKFKW